MGEGVAHDRERRRSRLTPALSASLTIAAAATGSTPVAAQAAENDQAAAPPASVEPGPNEILVFARIGFAKTEFEPLATVDADAIAATGATDMEELLRAIGPIAVAPDGGEPIFLLNGQRTSGYQEISALPPEAIDTVEVLPEPVASKFGYPPTRRVMNFITKRDFRQVELRGAIEAATAGGLTAAEGRFALTRLSDGARLSLGFEARRVSALRQSERPLATDPNVLFDSIGNLSGAGGGEIDPALSQAAGKPVLVAPVPIAEDERGSLAAYAAAANEPRLFDVGPYRTLQPRTDVWKASATMADFVGSTLSGSVSMSAEQRETSALSGPVAATLTVPASNPFSPFTGTVLLQRYLTEVAALRSRQSSTILHGEGVLRGATAGWSWDVTVSFDQAQTSGASERGIDAHTADAAIVAGSNPFGPLAPSLLGERQVDRSRVRIRAASAKLVVSGTVARLPAGDVTLTGSVESERLATVSKTRGANPFELNLSRGRAEAGLALDVPLTSRADSVVADVGDLSFSASANARRIEGFGALYDASLVFAWEPLASVQLLAQARQTSAAPAMEALASPVAQIANAPIFDFATGRTEIVTLVEGGNRDLAAERRRVHSVTLNLAPPSRSNLTASVTFEAADIRDQTGNLNTLTPQVERAFPDSAVRDASGRLVRVSLQPINFFRQQQRILKFSLSASGKVGKAPEAGQAGTTDDRPSFYFGAGPTVNLSDRLQLRRGLPALDLLRGDTVTGGGTHGVFGSFYGGIGYRGSGAGFGGWYGGRNRVRSGNPASDLDFSPILKINISAYANLQQVLPGEDWLHRAQLRLEIDNLTNARQRVRDRAGRVPYQLQPYFLDPIGRMARVTLRKIF